MPIRNRPVHLSVSTNGIVQPSYRPRSTLPRAESSSTISSGDLFSPLHWTDAGLSLTSDDINDTVNEFKYATVRSEDFGKETFCGMVASDADIIHFLETTRLYSTAVFRWRDVPRRCKVVNEIFSPMRALIDAVLEHFKYTKCAVMDSFNISTASMEHNMKLLPHFMGLGWGSNFGPLPSPFESGPSYHACTSFLELRTEEERQTRHVADDVVQLAFYARQCFRLQHNRKFVYGLIVTEQNFELCIFDRSGLCYSRPWDIHTHPIEFVRMILGIWSPDNDLIGFDTTIFWEKDADGDWHRYMASIDQSGGPMRYLLSSCPIFARWFIAGRGTTCWLTYDKDGTRLLIKDAWRDASQTREMDFLEVALNLQGVVQVIAGEEGESTAALRGAAAVASIPEELRKYFLDRQFCRTIFPDYGSSTIEDFQCRRDLLYGIRDAISGHQNLWNVGVLHGDINTENILLGSRSAPQGLQGVLIDLDMAMWVHPSRANGIFHRHGTRQFASLNVLEFFESTRRRFSRDYLDDLESFFYVLCKICSTFSGPGQKIAAKPDFVRAWDQDEPLLAANAKMNTLLCADYEPTSYFGSIFETLLANFHEFIAKAAGHKRTMRMRRERTGDPEPTWHDLKPQAERDYATVLGLIDDAIEDLSFGRFMPVYDPQLEAQMAELEEAKAAKSPVVAPPAVDRGPVKHISAHPIARRRACDEDDIGYDIPPPKKTRRYVRK